MRSSSIIALCLTACFQLSCNGLQTDRLISLPVESHELQNGLRILFLEDHTLPIVSYQTWYQVGSVQEHEGKTGLAHLFEHLMFKGTIRYGARQFFYQLEAKGAEVNAYTTRDYTVFHETLPPSLLEKTMDLESDRMANLVLTQELLDSERKVVLEERKMRVESSPEGKIQEALWELAYQKHPYRWPVIGYSKDLLSVEVEDLQKFFKNFYAPSNAVLVLVGDFQGKRTLELLKKYYGEIPKRSEETSDVFTYLKLPHEPELQTERRVVLKDEISSTRVDQAYRIVSALSEETYALDILSNLLFEGKASRAYRRLVEEKEIALTVSGTAYTPKYGGLFLMSGVLKKNAQVSDYERELWSVIEDIKTNGVRPEEVDRAIKHLTVQLVDILRTTHGMAQMIGTVYSVFHDPTRFVNDLARYSKVTPKEVQNMAKKYLIPQRRVSVILEPQSIAHVDHQ